jgi:hypothetical protein|mmetsp:Transcript_45088/g.59787  ORF Transcript_45088/g.59787 Transcript_45088/m.59787 type:complete len:207 (+) Transcript_45088:590-1210(+)|eukprot:Macronucleus_3769.p1 GENE.Macronucleus_3769~~Macronucleus_3769.p1  ORF type:complete len:207 (+),score=56.95 Macronucleus_3769:1-621(+)
MGRPVGFLWSYPGIISLTVPYFDTNDFYFSGHVGSTTIYSSEYLAMKWYKMAGVIIFCVVDVWIALTFLRTHYIIDFTSGYVYARFVHRYGEKLSYLADVKLLGWPRHKRTGHNYDPCPKCGWGNPALLQLTVSKEVDLQKKLYVAINGHEKTVNNNERSPLMSQGLDEEQLKRKNAGLAPSINTIDTMPRKVVVKESDTSKSNYD